MLIVDDEEANRIIVRRVLEQAGWSAVEAADGIEAVAAARRTLPSLIVMDIDMPRCDGLAATRAIRESAAPLSSVPILVYSAMPLTDVEVTARGMDGRIPKPFTPDQLIAAVEPWLQEGQLAGAQRLAGLFGEAELGRLVGGLREQLESAVTELDGTAIPTIAHRVAGLAGTLGFAAVSASWLALSEGDESARDQARRDARMAIAAIDRSELVAPHH
ncbi:response regulator [Sphingomonas panacisoli]|uniref:response regulator n=1 Tax=Sphingomonas panacisoli TaxID=1813879 RepID=UPI0016454CF0|nr:response regulator [Sphingomonas panacisoli]